MLHRIISVRLLAACAIASSANVAAENFIQQRALDPIKLQTGLPAAASRLTTSSELQLSLVHNNVFMGGLTDSERLILDGESSQLNVRYRRRINACWQLNFSGAWLAHSGGRLDNAVDAWHQFFGLPDAMRGDFPANQLQYTYENGRRRQSLSSAGNGLGDAQLQVQYYLGCHNAAPIVRAGVKLPVGDTEQFRGSGAVDSFVDVQSAWQRASPGARLHWAGSIGVLRSGKSDFIADQKPLVGFGVVGLNMSLNARWQLLGQLDWHTPLFDSELRELGDTAAQLSLGLRYTTQARGVWEISFAEDAVIDTAPDIVVRLAWTLRID